MAIASVKVKLETPGKGTGRRQSGARAVKKLGDGVVMSFVQGRQGDAGPALFTPASLIEALEAGLPFQELEILRASLDLPVDLMATMLGISKATFHRSKGTARRLSPSVSDRVVRYAKLVGFAVKVFGDLADAKLWLKLPQIGLGGAVPLDYAKTEIGAREVENLLGRIEYGVYS
jgi:putative toxin-antitoxin system antitoxin component (TIGR02293 family)